MCPMNRYLMDYFRKINIMDDRKCKSYHKAKAYEGPSKGSHSGMGDIHKKYDSYPMSQKRAKYGQSSKDPPQTDVVRMRMLEVIAL
jgi:hypothetical protein